MTTSTEMLRRWRLILGGDEADGTHAALTIEDSGMDAALSALYDNDPEHGKRGGLGGSAPRVSRGSGDIRAALPASFGQVRQPDAL